MVSSEEVHTSISFSNYDLYIIQTTLHLLDTCPGKTVSYTCMHGPFMHSVISLIHFKIPSVAMIYVSQECGNNDNLFKNNLF